MRRGEIYWVDFGEPVGSEVGWRRPAVVMSNDGLNTTVNPWDDSVVTVVPLTTNTEHIHPFQVPIPADESGLPQDSKAQGEQVRAVALTRLGAPAGAIGPALIAQLDDALRFHLSL